LVDILQMMGATVIPIERTDHFVPIDTEAVTQADEQKARDWVAQFELDALVTTDGDADRPLIADESGQWLRGDIVGLLTAQLLNAKVVVAPVSCNTALEASGFFENVLRTKIGSPYVIAGMQTLNPASQSIAGFEANGGFIAGENLTINGHSLVPLLTRDAMLPIVVLLGAAAQRGIALSALMANLPARYTVSDRLQNIPPVVIAMWLANWLASPEALCSIDSDLGGVSQLDTTDGLRVIFQNGEVIHLRASGNAPELRCYVESAELKRAKQLLQQTFIWINQLAQANNVK
jgi:phosphomannomutase